MGFLGPPAASDRRRSRTAPPYGSDGIGSLEAAEELTGAERRVSRRRIDRASANDDSRVHASCRCRGRAWPTTWSMPGFGPASVRSSPPPTTARPGGRATRTRQTLTKRLGKPLGGRDLRSGGRTRTDGARSGHLNPPGTHRAGTGRSRRAGHRSLDLGPHPATAWTARRPCGQGGEPAAVVIRAGAMGAFSGGSRRSGLPDTPAHSNVRGDPAVGGGLLWAEAPAKAFRRTSSPAPKTAQAVSPRKSGDGPRPTGRSVRGSSDEAALPGGQGGALRHLSPGRSARSGRRASPAAGWDFPSGHEHRPTAAATTRNPRSGGRAGPGDRSGRA